ncbi:preprotein translocase subunit YajC [Natranaerovirga hydrolytica]|uniref:Preprotein translocase subunit YajC n=1 Tax=Natranaerovirga hydrolytica TaxID=680378 RepID=A0A4V6NFI0_9FIRM|nr:preprotein translocase subunit YajC [Natranaerovirga hydrolytica]TCK97791.1 preprotein translocase subunit YajC [Natranaerovirga hydrolytica]
MSNLLFFLGGTANPAGNQGVLGIFIWVGFMVLLWFVMIRPQKKRQKAVSEMQSSIKVGDSILTTGGLFGKVVDEVNNLLIVEFGINKGVKIPILKESVAAIREPELTLEKEVENRD